MDDLTRLLEAHDFVVTRSDVVRSVGHHILDARLHSGEWRRLFPRVYLAPGGPLSERIALLHGALRHAGDGAHLTCSSAAMVWDLPVPTGGDVHVGALRPRRVAPCPGLVTHQFQHAHVVEGRGLAVVPRHVALVQAFGCLDRVAGRELVLASVQRRLIVPDRVRELVPPRMPSRADLLEIVDLAASGSHSELEIQLLLGVIRRFDLPEPVRQHPIGVANRRIFLDAAYPDYLVDLEADGRTWHFDANRRTADVARDAELAALGWVTLRFLREQIADQPEWVATQIERTLRARGWPGTPRRLAAS